MKMVAMASHLGGTTPSSTGTALSTERQRKYFEPEARLSKRNLVESNGAASRCTTRRPITSLLPKDNVEQLYAMLETTIMIDPVLVQEVRR
jgi:hypothetical protein